MFATAVSCKRLCYVVSLIMLGNTTTITSTTTTITTAATITIATTAQTYGSSNL